MSNHDGGYIANYVLLKCKENGFFENKDDNYIAEFLVQIASYLERRCDCNAAEVLEDLDREYGICTNCSERKSNLDEDGHCEECSKYYN